MKNDENKKEKLFCKIGTGEAAAAVAITFFFLADITSTLSENRMNNQGNFWETVELPMLFVGAFAAFYLFFRNLHQKRILGRMSESIQSLCELVSPDAKEQQKVNVKERLHQINESLLLKNMNDRIGQSEKSYKMLVGYKEQLKHEYDFYTHILNETPSLVVWLNLDGTVKYCNPALLRSTGYTLQELLGKEWWSVFYPGGKQEPEAVRLNHISDNGLRCIRDHVMELKNKHEEIRYISWTTANILDSDGNPIELIGIGTDITEERKRGAMETEEQKMKALASMAGGLAHEISNALQPILGLSELCAMHVAGKDKKLEESMHIIQRNALHCRNIVNGVLSFARRDVKKKQIQNLREVLEGAMEFADEFLPVEVRVRCRGFGDGLNDANSHLPVNINRTELVQIMANLFTNASHAMKSCGIIEVELGRVTFDGVVTQLHGMPNGDYAVISVKDSGYGMTEDVQKSLFQPFFTTKTVGEGTGLGLAAVYGIIKDWDGAIRVQSKPSEGSTFFLYIPIADDKATVELVNNQMLRGGLDENGKHTRH